MTLEYVLQKNAPLRNIHAGRRCFIIGNGPSLSSQDLKLLAGEINIVVTSFFRHPDAKVVQPGYWVIADPYFWEKPDEFFFPAFNSALATDLSTKLFVPTGGLQYFTKFNTGPLIETFFYHFDYSLDYRSIIDFTHGIPPNGNNVVMIAIMLAYFMGCNPIYLIGCDHDFLRTKKTEYDSCEVKHFYNESKGDRPSERLSWEKWEIAMNKLTSQYDQLSRYAEFWGFNIFNATQGGCLETFPRVEYESLFPQKTVSFLSQQLLTTDIYHLSDTAINLINAGNYQAALVLLDEAIRNNINRSDPIEGLYYLKTICLIRLSRHKEALQYARQDYACHLSNRHNSAQIIQFLEQFLDKKGN